MKQIIGAAFQAQAFNFHPGVGEKLFLAFSCAIDEPGGNPPDLKPRTQHQRLAEAGHIEDKSMASGSSDTLGQLQEIGRASCWERVFISVVAV